MTKPDLIQQLKDYINKTPEDVLQAELEEYSKKYNHIGPTINDYLNFIDNYRKAQYPKTYQECCDILGVEIDYGIALTYMHEQMLFSRLYELIRCRDAYWKIAGERMGLNKAWKPNLQNKKEIKYAITNVGNNFAFEIYEVHNDILLFPTEEMRKIFYENFTDLIETCKELL